MAKNDILIPENILRKIEELDYKLRDQDVDEGNGINYSFVKEIEDYIIELSVFYPFHKEDGIYSEIQIFEGTVGNQPPYINSKGEIDFHMGQECIISSTRNEQTLKSEIDKWDKKAVKKAKFFIDKTAGQETSTMRELGMSGNMSKLFDMVNDRKDVGRNDPCPCGSGKKYKHCCLN